MERLDCPAWVVVPASDPADCTESPAGSVPEARDAVYGALPAVALNEFVYAVPAVAMDRVAVLMMSGGGGGAVMVTRAAADLDESAALVAVIVAVESAVTVDA